MIEFIIPTYNRVDNLMSTLYSLVSQTNKNWKAHVVIDNASTILFDDVISLFKNEPRIKFTCINGPHYDAGHTPRNYGLEHSTGDWVIMTGDDNYYVPVFVNEVLSIIEDDTNFVYCDMIHNGYEYHFFNCHHSSHHIDIGNMIVRSELAKQLRLDVTKNDADGLFCTQYVNMFCKNEKGIKKINKILYVHN